MDQNYIHNLTNNNRSIKDDKIKFVEYISVFLTFFMGTINFTLVLYNMSNYDSSDPLSVIYIIDFIILSLSCLSITKNEDMSDLAITVVKFLSIININSMSVTYRIKYIKCDCSRYMNNRVPCDDIYGIIINMMSSIMIIYICVLPVISLISIYTKFKLIYPFFITLIGHSMLDWFRFTNLALSLIFIIHKRDTLLDLFNCFNYYPEHDFVNKLLRGQNKYKIIYQYDQLIREQFELLIQRNVDWRVLPSDMIKLISNDIDQQLRVMDEQLQKIDNQI